MLPVRLLKLEWSAVKTMDLAMDICTLMFHLACESPWYIKQDKGHFLSVVVKA